MNLLRKLSCLRLARSQDKAEDKANLLSYPDTLIPLVWGFEPTD